MLQWLKFLLGQKPNEYTTMHTEGSQRPPIGPRIHWLQPDHTTDETELNRGPNSNQSGTGHHWRLNKQGEPNMITLRPHRQLQRGQAGRRRCGGHQGRGA